jgi:hypothetical protein
VAAEHAPTRPYTSTPVSTPQPPLTVSAAAARAVPSADERRAPQGLDLTPQPTASDQLTTALSESALSPVQVALQQAYSGEPLRLEGSGIDTMLDAYDAPAMVYPKQAQAREAEQLAQDRRSVRQDALDSGRGETRGQRVRNQTRSMTQGQYDALTPQQRAAVDFNRMLLSAVRKDQMSVDDAEIGGKHGDKYQPTAEEKANYDKALKDMFGEDTPEPSQFAPETLGVLRQIGFHDDSATLDDFLSGKALIGRKQIERMAPETMHLDSEHTGPLAPGTNPAPGLDPITSTEAQRDKFDLAKTLAYDTGAMQAAMAKTQPLLATITDVAKVERNDDVTQLGGTPNKVKPTVGYGNAQYDQNGVPQDLNSYFQLAFERIASKEMDPKQVLADANAMLSPEEFSQFHSYMANRAINAQRYELPLGANPKAKYMKPEQFIKLLKLDQPGGE